MVRISVQIYHVLMFALLMAGTRCEESESCDQSDLDDCVAALPGGRHRGHALPLTLPHIQELCRTYRIGMDCIEAWTQRCLPTETKIISDKQTLGARQMMKFLCHDATFRREYLNHTLCFRAVSSDWQRCMAQLSAAARAIAERSRSVLYVDPRNDICCAREEFQECVARSGRAKCTRAGAVLLRRIAETLAADEGRCAACGAETLRSASALAVCLLAVAVIRRAAG